MKKERSDDVTLRLQKWESPRDEKPVEKIELPYAASNGSRWQRTETFFEVAV
jgi:hypothetical protein